MTATETLDERADRLLSVGLDVAVRIRDEDPNDVARALGPLTRTDLRDLVVLLGACLPVDQPATTLAAWWTAASGHAQPTQPVAYPHGHHLRYRKHKRDGDEVCDVCTAGYRAYERDRKAKARRAARERRQGLAVKLLAAGVPADVPNEAVIGVLTAAFAAAGQRAAA